MWGQLKKSIDTTNVPGDLVMMIQQKSNSDSYGLYGMNSYKLNSTVGTTYQKTFDNSQKAQQQWSD